MKTKARKFSGGVTVRAETVNTKRVFKWRLVGKMNGEVHTTEWTSYYAGVEVLDMNGRKFGYATDYWSSYLPIEEPFEIILGK